MARVQHERAIACLDRYPGDCLISLARFGSTVSPCKISALSVVSRVVGSNSSKSSLRFSTGTPAVLPSQKQVSQVGVDLPTTK